MSDEEKEGEPQAFFKKEKFDFEKYARMKDPHGKRGKGRINGGKKGGQ